MNYVITIGFNHDKSTTLLLIDVHNVSLVSAQKLSCASSARNLPSSARLSSWNFSSNSSLKSTLISSNEHRAQHCIKNEWTLVFIKLNSTASIFVNCLECSKASKSADFADTQYWISPKNLQDTWIFHGFYADSTDFMQLGFMIHCFFKNQKLYNL